MTAEQFFSIALLGFVIVVTVLKLIANEMEHKMILKQNVIDLKKQYDAAWARFEAAAIQADKDRYTEKKDESAGRRLKAHGDYMYWQKIFRRYRDTAAKAGINIPGIC